MNKTSVNNIKQIAQKLAKERKEWHFHILTPECFLNETSKHSLVLENVEDNEKYITYSNKPFMGIGQELVKLLHGEDVMQDQKEVQSKPPSAKVKILLKRAMELRKNDIFWHHHMLFPGCKYNKHGKKWVIVFEDQEKSKIIESTSNKEPKSDLQHIEGLFYSQKK